CTTGGPYCTGSDCYGNSLNVW
nr:immunoglobulin heavy chain junction region [Macaca mulatta]